MRIERGVAGVVPYAALGSGSTVVVCAGLSPSTGVDSDRLVRGAVAPLRRLAGSRRLIVVNRRTHLPSKVSMSELAAEYADAIRAEFGSPVDVLGTSTGGSIAQQLAADHPDVLRRLVLLSTACRLSPTGRDLQAQVAARLRANRYREAVGLVAANLAPLGLRTLAHAAGWATARHLIPDDQTAADLATTLEAEDRFDLSRCAGPIRARTLILGGARDRVYGTDLFTATAALIPDSDLWIAPRRGHLTAASDPRIQATIAGFLSRP